MASHPLLEFICIDVANGYAESFVAFVSRVRQAYPEKTVIAGNVVTGEMVEELFYPGRMWSRWESARAQPALPAPRQGWLPAAFSSN